MLTCGIPVIPPPSISCVFEQGFSQNLHVVLCLAENAVGPKATRPDDVHTFYSGKTVEVNNTDAEGRLVLGDGVAYARKDLGADVVVDMATLTGAQVSSFSLQCRELTLGLLFLALEQNLC